VWSRLPAFGLVSGKSSHADRVATIRAVWERYAVEIDPHTADGFKVAMAHRETGVTMVCLETAQAAKFESTMVEALGRKPARPKALDGIENLPQRVESIDADAETVKRIIAQAVGDRS
jgi:threonine synthase